MQGIEYICKECGYNKKFSWGLAMLDSEGLYENEKAIVEQFEKEVMEGKYGELLQQYARLMKNNIVFARNECLFQCHNCWKISIHRMKKIMLCYSSKQGYTQETILEQECPFCGNNRFFETHSHPLCPKCKNRLEVKGMWRE